MKYYHVYYRVRGMFSLLPMFIRVLTNSEEDAKIKAIDEIITKELPYYNEYAIKASQPLLTIDDVTIYDIPIDQHEYQVDYSIRRNDQFEPYSLKLFAYNYSKAQDIAIKMIIKKHKENLPKQEDIIIQNPFILE